MEGRVGIPDDYGFVGGGGDLRVYPFGDFGRPRLSTKAEPAPSPLAAKIVTIVWPGPVVKSIVTRVQSVALQDSAVSFPSG